MTEGMTAQTAMPVDSNVQISAENLNSQVQDGQTGQEGQDFHGANTDQDNQGSQYSNQENQKNTKTNNKENFNPKEMEIISKFMKSWNVPKGWEPVLDKGQVKFYGVVDKQAILATPEELIKGFGLTQAGYERLSHAKEIENRYKQLESKISKDPNELINYGRQLGLSDQQIEEFAFNYLSEKTKYNQMSPQERALHDREQKIKEREKAIEESRLNEEQAKHHAMVSEIGSKITSELIEAAQKHGFTQPKPGKDGIELTELMLDTVNILANYGKNNKQIPVADAMWMANQNYERKLQKWLVQHDVNQVVKLLPKNIKEAIRKELLSQVPDIPTANSIDGMSNRVDLSRMRVNRQPQQQQRGQTITDFKMSRN